MLTLARVQWYYGRVANVLLQGLLYFWIAYTMESWFGYGLLVLCYLVFIIDEIRKFRDPRLILLTYQQLQQGKYTIY